MAVGSAIGTVYNAIISARNYDRAAGKVRAKLEVVGFLPDVSSVPPDLQKFSPITKLNELTLHEAEDILRLNPRVVVRNVGDEPIDSIRLETRSEFNFIDMIGEPATRQTPTPWALEEAVREDYLLMEKLKPGKIAEVRMAKGLLAQMAQLQARDREDRLHYSRFQVRCMARLVGMTAYDGAEDQKVLAVRIVWLPKGFPDATCKKLLQDFKPVPFVEP